MKHWWEAPEWADRKPMEFGKQKALQYVKILRTPDGPVRISISRKTVWR